MRDHQCSCYSCVISAKSPAIALEAACARLALASVDGNNTDDSWDVLVMAKKAYINSLTSDIEISCSLLGIQRFAEVSRFILISLRIRRTRIEFFRLTCHPI